MTFLFELLWWQKTHVYFTTLVHCHMPLLKPVLGKTALFLLKAKVASVFPMCLHNTDENCCWVNIVPGYKMFLNL